MGSFTEVALSFSFTPWTPPRVLAAFSRLASNLPPDAPRLPDPVVEAYEDFEPDWREAGEDEQDPFEHEPWRHDWAMWCSTAMGVGTTPYGRLTWSQATGWTLDCRFSWKTTPDVVSQSLAWLAPHVALRHRALALVGHAQHEYEDLPHVYVTDGVHWLSRNLNTLSFSDDSPTGRSTADP